MDTKNQFEFIIQYLKKEKINIDFEEFKFQIETHPDFPSLLSFSEALNFFRIDNVAAKIPKEQIDQLPDNFVALLQTEQQGQLLSYVKKRGDYYKYSVDKSTHIASREDFLNTWQGIILVVEKTEDTKIINKPNNNLFLWLLVGLFSILFITCIIIPPLFALKKIILFPLNLVGLYLAIEALKQEFGIKSTFSSAFCGSNSSQLSNCESVITSKKAKIFSNFGLSDLGIVFFTGHLFSFFLMSISNLTIDFVNLSFVILIPAIPVTLFSIYYQWLIEKKWCPICLMIIAVLYLELGIYAFFSNFIFNELRLFSILIFLLGFISSLLIWVTIKPYITNYFELKSSQLESIRFKRNYKLFKLALKDSKKIDYKSIKSVLSVGNPDARLKITIVTNPFCGYCTEAHKILDDLMLSYPNQITLNIRFNFNHEHTNDDSKFLHYRLVQLYFEKGANIFMEALGLWFKDKDLNKWFSQFGKGEINTKTEQILTIQNKQNQDNALTFTPAIIIGDHLYPNIYNRSELPNFISELIDDKDFWAKN